MKRMKKWMAKWFLALLATAMVLVSLAGCNAGDVNQALDVAIEVLEVVESLEAESIAAEEAVKKEQAALPSQTDSLQQTSETSTQTNEKRTEEAGEGKQEASKEETTPNAETDQAEPAEKPSKEPEKAEADESEEEVTIEEDGHYTSKEEVALYLHVYGKLPSNFISKKEAEELGWKKKQGEAGQLHKVAPGMSIGGSSFGNYEGLLPEKKGRKYYECDINYVKGNRGAERIVYSNDGLIFYTGDHYESFEQLYPKA